MDEAIKMTNEEKKMVLDARIRNEAKWAFERSEDGHAQPLSEKVLAKRVFDSVVSSFDYSDKLLDASRSVKFSVKYVEGVIAAMRKDMSESKVQMCAMIGAAVEDSINEAKKEKQPKLGTGERFKRLKNKLAAKGVQDPAALAASIGRKKFGKKRFQKLAAKGK